MFILQGEVPERPKGADCKSAGTAFGGSNPPLSTAKGGNSSVEEHQPSKLRVAGSNPVSRSRPT